MPELKIDLFQYRQIPQNFGRIVTVNQDKDAILLRGGLDAYELSPKPNEWLVTRDWAFWSARLQQVIYIPAWFVTDLASIPRLARVLVPRGENERIPALIHDYLYALFGEKLETPVREDADGVFRDFCKLCGVGLFRRNAMYFAVRGFGWTHYSESDGRFFAPMEHRKYYLEAAEWGVPPLDSDPLSVGS
jgi:hypothetical protein